MNSYRSSPAPSHNTAQPRPKPSSFMPKMDEEQSMLFSNVKNFVVYFASSSKSVFVLVLN